MPVIAQNVSLAAGATSTNVFDNTNYQFVNEGTEIRVALMMRYLVLTLIIGSPLIILSLLIMRYYPH